ncbi:MAG: hypothetical protein NC928_00960 [Candidatus Omnitrophica bacterium]|nr:hypothetical protein [Candidatus Omnitrophota bacterium]
MAETCLKRTIFISLLGHLVLFSIFSLSFGPCIPTIDYTPVNFWGIILSDAELITHKFRASPQKEILKRTEDLLPDKTKIDYSFLPLHFYLKPPVDLSININKMPYLKESPSLIFVQRKKSSVMMFYPQLPYHFLVYFKDREVAHIELMFNVLSKEGINTIAIKRKISSGNLEVDLLAMRYISHYLFIQQKNFTPNNWQSVKIDLSAKND